MEIGFKIKELRLEHKMSQMDLASAINYSKAIIGFWENSVHEPTASAIAKIALLFDVPTDYLLGLEDEFGNKAI